jgi:RimJ/RimL family protein N-acetyltransferase
MTALDTAARPSIGEIAVGVPAERDIPALIALINVLAAEPSYFFILPLDPVSGVGALKSHLATIAASDNEKVLVAHCGGELVGLVTGTRGPFRERRGCIEIGVGVAPTCRGRGIGRALLVAVETWARQAGVHRLHLTVAAENAAAIALYRKLGFVVEGTQRASAEIGGVRIDELMMAKLIG